MMQYKSSSELKETAREKLSGKYGSAMLVSPVLQGVLSLVTLLPVMIIFILFYTFYLIANTINSAESFDESLSGFMLIYFILIVLCSLLIGVSNTGIAYFHLNVACGRQHSVSDFFYGFRYHFKKSLALTVIQTIPGFLFMTPYLICCFAWAMNPQTYWLIATCIAYVFAIVASVYVQLLWSQTFYLLLDFPQTGVIDLLKLSMRIMKGHKKRLLYIQLSFIPLELLCMCSCYVGYLWYVPYVKMTYTLFFLDLMQPAKTENASESS